MKPNIAKREAIIRFGGCFFCARKGGKEAGSIGLESERKPGGCRKTGGKADSPDGRRGLCCVGDDGSDVPDGICNGYFWDSQESHAAGVYGCGRAGNGGSRGVCGGVPVLDEFLQVGKDRG